MLQAHLPHPDKPHQDKSLSVSIKRSDVNTAVQKLINRMVAINDTGGTFVLDLENGVKADTKSWNVWDWTQGVGLYGLMRHVSRTGDAAMLAHIEHWFAHQASLPPPHRNINTMAPIYTMAWLAEIQGHHWRAQLESWGEWAMSELPRTDEGGFQHIVIDKPNTQQLWDDTLMMTALPLAKLGVVLDRPDYIDEAIRQFIVHARFLTDLHTGLWYHGWSFIGRHHFAKALWARGNSWITMAIPDLIETLDLAPTHSAYLFLVEVLKTQVSALEKRQLPSGLWPTLLDDPTSYGEASATAGFAYGILKAVRMGLIDASYAACGERAAVAVFSRISDAGELTEVSFGTPMFDSLDDYRQVPLTEMPYGQAMAVLALEEFALLIDGDYTNVRS